MIGLKSDNLPKPTDNMQNIQNDAEHSFYSTHCDYFVVIDKKLDNQNKVLLSSIFRQLLFRQKNLLIQ